MQIGEAMNNTLFVKKTATFSKIDHFESPSVPSAIIFMSGSGTNAVKLLESPDCGKLWKCSAIVTDRVKGCRAKEIADRFNVPYILHDIFQFYKDHGSESISVATERGMELRNLWTDELRKKIADIPHDFGLLAGFVPLSNIVGDFPCLNVHPGDLTIEKDGVRLLAGLHSGPVETAILEKHPALKSSVIIATPYIPGEKNVDAGFILGVSDPVAVELPEGVTLEQLHECKKNRVKGRDDLLGKIADEHIDRLKEGGDWKLFPAVTAAFTQGRYAYSEDNTLLWRCDDGIYRKVKTVLFENGTINPVFL